MGRRSKIILGFLVAVLIGIIVTEITRPRPLNWRPSYTADSKIPFGCHVLFNELPSIFPNSKIESVDESVYDVLINRDSSQLSNFLFINNFISFDEQETNKLLSYVSAGNHVFIATNGLQGKLADTLNIEIEQHYEIKEDSLNASFTNQNLPKIKFKFERGADPTYFTSIDTSKTTILGHIQFKESTFLADQSITINERPNFIKTAFGKGSFIINTLPVAFTNYYVLGENKEYVESSFSYLNDATIFWDDYKKSGRTVINSPLRFILAQPSLKWSYYLLVFGLLLFVIFKAKREQRIIPVIKPLENSSVEFAKTVGSLYHQNRDFTNLNNKKIIYFLTYLRNRLYVNTTNLDENLITQVAAKAGKTIEETKSLIDLIVGLKNKPLHTEQDTIKLTKKINTFKQSYGRSYSR
ncbi:DUF4350 domain-containing protein [Maribacter hydrothermalis]|uniref:DUF4350 domain-containing protein n=1 Tax=Maribacter hydrothermalis TaxID=1836467 RepID=A0A1B7ZBK6_9FLAO|nr:DUF4350 domain-containing protein [Maribacter hydrothermalis]APQ16344.1 hypothetical protein BTR34_02860 [Maribacter hydrothermalis]OBR40088.1 hypothetical protein A9200_16530 [Maribacter hydrothermalis]